MLLRECTMALACGVNLTLAPDTGVVFKQAGMLAIDGRCKVHFDADADGYVRGEAGGVLLLDEGKSTEFGGSVVCFAGSAVNQDGQVFCLDGTKRSSTTEGHIQCDAEGFLDHEYVCGHSQHAWYGYSSWGPHWGWCSSCCADAIQNG